MLGHVLLGSGPLRVLVLHDWMGDHHNYDPLLAYLDGTSSTWAFADLRGYGLSRELSGRFDLSEAADDVLALAEHLGWDRFHLVGHSMSSLVAQQVAASAPERVAGLVLITPVAPTGMGAPEEVVGFLEKMALDEDLRHGGLANQWGDRLWPGWAAFKLKRWSESCTPGACRGYVRMFACTAVSGALPRDLPVLAIAGEHDKPPFLPDMVRAATAATYDHAEVVVCTNAGHYPMQETPVALASAIQRFLSADRQRNGSAEA